MTWFSEVLHKIKTRFGPSSTELQGLGVKKKTKYDKPTKTKPTPKPRLCRSICGEAMLHRMVMYNVCGYAAPPEA
jgi:hypothetical protein